MKGNNNMTNFWKELGSVKSVYQEQIEAVQKNNQLLTKNGIIYYRAKPKNKRISNKRMSKHKYISIILAMVLVGLAMRYTYLVKTIDYISPVDGMENINLDPVRFTEQELETFYGKHTKQAHAGTVTDNLIIEIFGDDAEWAFECLRSENAGHNPTATNKNRNGTIDTGIFQVNSIHCGKIGLAHDREACIEELKKPEVNIKIAKQIYDTSGSKAWFGKSCN